MNKSETPSPESESPSPKKEPPSPSERRSVLVGRNSRGHWVVQDPGGLYGGLFINRVQALKYAMSENGKDPQAVITVPWVLELDLMAVPRVGEHLSAKGQTENRRAA